MQELFEGRCRLLTGMIPQGLVPPREILMGCVPERPALVTLYGKTHESPRFTQAYGRSYTYSGQEHHALPVPDWLQVLMDWAAGVAGCAYNSALVNWYMDGNHYIAPHSDDERPLVPGGSVFTCSFGETRKFRLRPKDHSSKPVDYDPPHASYLVMLPPTQTHCTHEIVKVSGEKGKALGPRVSVTFRAFA